MKKLLFPFIFLFLFSCASPNKSLKNQEYKNAYDIALKRLQRGANPNKNKIYLHKALTQITASNVARKAMLATSSDADKLQEALNLNLQMMSYFSRALAYLDQEQRNTYLTLVKEEQNLRQRIAAKRFEEGLEELDIAKTQENKHIARKAYHLFMIAKEYGLEEAALGALIDRSLDLAQLFVYIETKSERYDEIIKEQFARLEEEDLLFRQFKLEKESNEKIADCKLRLVFDNPNFQYSSSSSTDSYTKEVVIGCEITHDTLGNKIETPIYGDITGSVTTTTKEKRASWNMNIEVTSGNNNCWLQAKTIRLRVIDEVEDKSTSGDTNAIPFMERSFLGSNSNRSDAQMCREMLFKAYKRFIEYSKLE